MRTFTITGYSKTTDTVTVNFNDDGTIYTGVKVQGIPKDSVANVKAFMDAYATAYAAGKAQEAATKADIANEVKALLNVATEF